MEDKKLSKKVKIWQGIVFVELIFIIALLANYVQQQRLLVAQDNTINGLKYSLQDREQKLMSTMSLLQRAVQEITQGASMPETELAVPEAQQ